MFKKLLIPILAAVLVPVFANEVGYSVYKKVCVLCHEAKVGPNLLGRRLPSEVTMVMVRSGVGAMPAFRKTEISDSELEAVANFIYATPAVEKKGG